MKNNKKLFYASLLILNFFISAVKLYAQEGDSLGKVLSLEECRALALQYNKDLSSASRQRTIADYTYKSYKANFFPKITANATAAYSTADGSLAIKGGNLPTFVVNPATGEPVPNGGFAYFPGLKPGL